MKYFVAGIIVAVFALVLVEHYRIQSFPRAPRPNDLAQAYPVMAVPITHGFSNVNPTEKDWEITDPKFAHWIEDHCYVVKPNPHDPATIRGEELYRLKCTGDVHSDRVMYQ